MGPLLDGANVDCQTVHFKFHLRRKPDDISKKKKKVLAPNSPSCYALKAQITIYILIV